MSRASNAPAVCDTRAGAPAAHARRAASRRDADDSRCRGFDVRCKLCARAGHGRKTRARVVDLQARGGERRTRREQSTLPGSAIRTAGAHAHSGRRCRGSRRRTVGCLQSGHGRLRGVERRRPCLARRTQRSTRPVVAHFAVPAQREQRSAVRDGCRDATARDDRSRSDDLRREPFPFRHGGRVGAKAPEGAPRRGWGGSLPRSRGRHRNDAPDPGRHAALVRSGARNGSRSVQSGEAGTCISPISELWTMLPRGDGVRRLTRGNHVPIEWSRGWSPPVDLDGDRIRDDVQRRRCRDRQHPRPRTRKERLHPRAFPGRALGPGLGSAATSCDSAGTAGARRFWRETSTSSPTGTCSASRPSQSRGGSPPRAGTPPASGRGRASRSPRRPGRRTSPARPGARARGGGARRGSDSPSTASQRKNVASPPASRRPAGSSAGRSVSRLRRYTSRTASTCSSSDHAATEARWTNSCGAVPDRGRNARSASQIAGAAHTNPER